MNSTDAARATAKAMPEIDRRRFLLTTAIAGTAVVAVVPAVSSEPKMTVRERAIWHMKELERLALEDGAREATVVLCGHGYDAGYDLPFGKSIALHPGGRMTGVGDIFVVKGGAA